MLYKLRFDQRLADYSKITERPDAIIEKLGYKIIKKEIVEEVYYIMYLVEGDAAPPILNYLFPTAYTFETEEQITFTEKDVREAIRMVYQDWLDNEHGTIAEFSDIDSYFYKFISNRQKIQ